MNRLLYKLVGLPNYSCIVQYAPSLGCCPFTFIHLADAVIQSDLQ